MIINRTLAGDGCQMENPKVESYHLKNYLSGIFFPGNSGSKAKGILLFLDTKV